MGNGQLPTYILYLQKTHLNIVVVLAVNYGFTITASVQSTFYLLLTMAFALNYMDYLDANPSTFKVCIGPANLPRSQTGNPSGTLLDGDTTLTIPLNTSNTSWKYDSTNYIMKLPLSLVGTSTRTFGKMTPFI